MTGDKTCKKDAEIRDLENHYQATRTRYKTKSATKRTTRARTGKNLIGSGAKRNKQQETADRRNDKVIEKGRSAASHPRREASPIKQQLAQEHTKFVKQQLWVLRRHLSTQGRVSKRDLAELNN